MNGLLRQFGINLRLHFRNRMALIYSYIFPTIFLLAFWVLYRYDSPPLVRHMGELLTVTVLGGACFGLPTTLVSERERGVWRRYRLTPVPTSSLVTSTVAARYLLLLTAGLVQLALAMLLGMPFPKHPFELWVAFSCVSFAFLGVGLVLATMADNVPAVQALGQCIFLPMLIIGGVAVPLQSLPDWAQHVSGFLPGRYAVDALNATVMGGGLGTARFAVAALLLIGLAGCVAGARLFRWDAQQRFAAVSGKGWVVVALAAWAAVGIAAETRHRTVATTAAANIAPAAAPGVVNPGVRPPTTSAAPEPPSSASTTSTSVPPDAAAAPGSAAVAAVQPPVAPSPAPSPGPPAAPPAAASSAPVAPAPATSSEPAPPAPAGRAPGAPPVATSWQAVTLAEIEREIKFTGLPPDGGIFTPIASPLDEPEPEIVEQLETLRARLPDWPPGKVPDIVQRVRNMMYIASVPDVLQAQIERFAPLVVYDQLQQDIPSAQLIQALYWVATHPMDGDDAAINQLQALGMNFGGTDPYETRNRAAFYSVKLLGRLTGKIVVK